MTTVPTGLPAWTRTATHEQYGGHANKADYQGQGVVNPRTDVGAAHIARMAADLEAAVRTAPFAVLTIKNQDTQHERLDSGGRGTGFIDPGPDAPLIESPFMMTGVRTMSYAGAFPHTGFPPAARNGTGDVTLTFASSYA